MSGGPIVAAEQRRAVLHLASFVGFLTADLVADWVWPGSAHGRKYAERILAALVKKGALLRRPLGGRAGAFVLTKAGSAEIDGHDGLRWGRMVKDVLGEKRWAPPPTFDHDLRAARFGIWVRHQTKWQPVFEREAGKRKNKVEVPDCLLVSPEKGLGIWVEVENRQKNAKERHEQIGEALSRMLRPAMRETPWGTVKTQLSVFVLPPVGYKDNRGYAIDPEPLLRREWSELGSKTDELAVLEDKIEWTNSEQEIKKLKAEANKLRETLTAQVFRDTGSGFERLEDLRIEQEQ